jgi:hypothetical protein
MSPYSGTQFAMYRPAPYTSNAGKLSRFLVWDVQLMGRWLEMYYLQ